MTGPLCPSTTKELGDIVADASRRGGRLRIRGGGSKDDIGAPIPSVPVLDMRRFTGVVDYDPPELVLTAGAGTPLAEIEALVASQGQMLAFDPYDHGTLLGTSNGQATIGGIVAAGVSGPRRLSGGAARDHLLGFEAVSGRGRAFRAGARVVKNVTGFDLSKLVTGSWGRLVALTSVTLKVVPTPESSRTLWVHGLDPDTAIAAMARAAGSAAGITAAAHLPDWQGAPATLFRIDGIAESVTVRIETLRARIDHAGGLEPLAAADGDAIWESIRVAAPLPKDRPLWRILVSPGKATTLLAALGGSDYILDWAGGLVWAATLADARVIRAAAVDAGGHASLIRGTPAMRAGTTAFHPPPAGVARLEAGIRFAFDPDGVFDTGRF